MKSFVCEVVTDPETGELILDLGTELCGQLGWSTGDVLEWTDNKDGSWTLTKRTNTYQAS